MQKYEKTDINVVFTIINREDYKEKNNFSFQNRIIPKKVVFLQPQKTGYSVVRLSRLLWEQEVASSNLAIPTKNEKGHNDTIKGSVAQWIEQLPSKQ